MTRSVQTILLRVAYLCSRYGKLAAIALVVVSSVALAGSAVAYTASPPTAQITQQTDLQTFSTTVNTSAAVTGTTALYGPDDKLSNMPVYLLAASPEMTLRAHTDVPDDRAVDVTQQITMELYATRDEEVFWTETTTLATDTQQVTDGSLVTETTINVSDIRRGRLHEVQPEVKNVGTLHATLHVDTVYNSDTYSGHLSVTTPVEITDRAYAIETPQSAERRHSTPVTQTVTRTDDQITFGAPAASPTTAQAGLWPTVGGRTLALPKQSAVWGGFGVGGLLAALILWRVYRQSSDWESIKRTYDKTRYREWISFGTIPESAEYERVSIEGLTDLLDIAIDCNKRIIHDPRQNRYAVVAEAVIYEYNEALAQIDAYMNVAAGEHIKPPSREEFFESAADDATAASVWEAVDDTIDSGSEAEPLREAPLSSTAAATTNPRYEPDETDIMDALSDADEIDSSVWEQLSHALGRSAEGGERTALFGSPTDDAVDSRDETPGQEPFGDPADE